MLEIIGITGGIASGKSKATRYLERCGYHVIDCDVVYHQLLQKNDDIPRTLWQSGFFPEKCFDFDIQGKKIQTIQTIQLNKPNLREFLFGNEFLEENVQRLKNLGEITHPFIFSEINQQLKKIEERKPKNAKVFIAIPLLFERWDVWKPILHQVWTIEVSEKIQKKRLKYRYLSQQKQQNQKKNSKSISSSVILALQTMYNIIKYQATSKERQSIADLIIDNNGDSWQMLKQLKEVLRKKINQKTPLLQRRGVFKFCLYFLKTRLK